MKIKAERTQGGIRLRGGAKPSKPLISVIVAVFNGEKYLDQVIRSVLDQSFANFELIIVDGGSTDGSINIIRQFDDRIDYWISEADRGIYDAWNKGISVAKGEWIAFLGCDDAYYQDALKNYASFLEDRESESLEYVSSRVDYVTPDLKPIKIIGSPWTWSKFRKKMNVAHVGSLHHRSLFERYGIYDLSYKITGDYELLLRARGKLKAGYLDAVTAMMRSGGTSYNMIRAFAEAKRAKHLIGRRNYLFCMIDNAVNMTKILLKKVFLKKYRT